ncbi:unnamed protein product [Strongylus vulgaris]|uniref:Uncharacterized protein n=1 Tax=Strongylus vulgaris TaxID=40348 RepID=A0A3P7LQB2_STRVU|nr:unnamed protein product [Strongylus vulgaris]
MFKKVAKTGIGLVSEVFSELVNPELNVRLVDMQYGPGTVLGQLMITAWVEAILTAFHLHLAQLLGRFVLTFLKFLGKGEPARNQLSPCRLFTFGQFFSGRTGIFC